MTRLRELPSVHDVLDGIDPILRRLPHSLVVAQVRTAVDRARETLRHGGDTGEITGQVEQALRRLLEPSLRRVINATGVVLHTNLGRAPLGALAPHSGYCNLEYDLAEGKRGKRDAHTADLLNRLLGRPAIVVNNGAAALFLALHELAAGQEVIVSRGELIEIGEGFRIPDIMQRSGAVLREVGATNRTSVEDYREAITDRTRLILRVHPSNFHMTGFTARPGIRELAELGRERAIPVYEDLGSGCMVDLRPFGITEPVVGGSLEAGVNLVSFSGDKLLGGPQAGVLAGDAEIVARLRRNPMFRALRVDKTIYQAMESTLRSLLLEEWDRVPALRMIRLGADEIRERAEHIVLPLDGLDARVEPSQSVIGGGSTPDQSIPTYVISIPDVERRLRLGDPPVIARVDGGRTLLDLRTVFPEEEPELIARLRSL